MMAPAGQASRVTGGRRVAANEETANIPRLSCEGSD
jgi:hypothetical protein